MAFVEWKPQYSVGVLEIDAQHRRLLEVINQLHDAMKTGGNSRALTVVVNELVGYTRYHFAFEEKMLEDAGYPDLDEHRRKHRAMVGQVEAFREAAVAGGATVSMKLMNFLKDWLTKHILETDMRYSEHLVGASK